MEGPRSQQQYPSHELYFDRAAGQGHHVSLLHSESSPVGPQSLGMKAGEAGSPPPNSTITSGSTSTPTSPSIGGASGDCSSKNQGAQRDYCHEALGSAQDQGCSPTADGTAVSPSAIKLLVSNNVAGSIIGRSGQTISDLQKKSSARIKLSQTGDYYPGTQDRVCLIQGQTENVKLALRLLLERLYMLQEQHHSQSQTWQPTPSEPTPVFDFMVRLLVPSSSCGMLIGKSGSNIKNMEERSGVLSVRLSPKEMHDPISPSAALASSTSERIVTVTGPSMESTLACLCIVLDGMVSHQDVCRYANMTTSYSRVAIAGSYHPAQLPPQGGRHVLVPPGGNLEAGMWDASGPYAQFAHAKRPISTPDLNTLPVMWDRGALRPNHEEHSPPPQRQLPQDQHPYNPPYADGAVNAFASHEVGAMIQPPNRPPGAPVNTNTQPIYIVPPQASASFDQSQMPNSTSEPDLLAMQMQESLRIRGPESPVGGDFPPPQFLAQHPQPTPPGFTTQIFVPDSLVGSILGRGGRTLNELQMHSNTRIRISQRGEYVPGTRNRIVTIRGPTAQAVSYAQYLMSQRMVLPPTASYPTQTPPFQHPIPLQAQQQQRHSAPPPPPHHGHDNAAFPLTDGPGHTMMPLHASGAPVDMNAYRSSTPSAAMIQTENN